jgi:hypothetical protein
LRSERDAILSVQRFMAGVLPEPWDIRTTLETGDPPVRPFALIEQIGPAATAGAPVTQDITLPITVSLYLPALPTREAAEDAARALRETVWAAVKWGPDPRRPTTDRIPLWCYDDRLEVHRFTVAGATGGTFTASVGGVAAAPLAPTVIASDLAIAIEAAFVTAGTLTLAPGDVVGQDRGAGLWDVIYGGQLVGEAVGSPTIDGTALAGAQASATARVLLAGAIAPWRGDSDYMRVTSFGQQAVADQADPTLVMVAVDLRLTFARGLPLPSDLRVLQRVSATGGNGG